MPLGHGISYDLNRYQWMYCFLPQGCRVLSIGYPYFGVSAVYLLVFQIYCYTGVVKLVACRLLCFEASPSNAVYITVMDSLAPGFAFFYFSDV